MKHFMAEPLRVLSKHLGLWHQVMRDRNVLETAKNRSLVAGAAFCVVFLLIFVRLADVMVIRSLWISPESDTPRLGVAAATAGARADILDRNGEILATHLVTASVYANPKVIINAEEAAAKLSGLIPELDYKSVLRKLSSGRKGFVWVVRHIPPKLQQSINQLGIPGIYLQRDERRVYPYGALVSHVLGYCGIDNNGLAGIEKYFDGRLTGTQDPMMLSIDMRVQHIVHDELSKAVHEFEAEGGSAMVMEIKTGEILSMVSLPDYDPNLPNQNQIGANFNRNTLGTYESGSIFKIFNTAIALETGTASLKSLYDATLPIRVGRFQITDFKGKKRVLDVREVFIHSSNIGSAKMALQFGGAVQKQYLDRFGLLKAPTLELPEIGSPLVPKIWRPVTTMTVAYGYGITASPLQSMVAVAGIVNDGWLRPATLLKRDPASMPEPIRIVSSQTSRTLRDLMRMVVTEGTAKTANVPGYEVMGKTGSAHKMAGRGYADKAKLTSFIGVFPKSDPQYIVLLFLDNPKPTIKTHGYATGGWNAAPTGGRIIARMAPLLGVVPVMDGEAGETMAPQMNLTPVNHVQEDDIHDTE
ncbi:MAG: penicillin-binding protein 2 [Alphaproteobacteria bacterium]|jgi:cell division protein FtsI (penicillin-binding protein 3)|nr:penicillin-binding protein 2 [Alphaproteobacteria bacterium]